MAPKAEKKPAKKVVKAAGGKGRQGKKSVETYKIYIYKVLKQVGGRGPQPELRGATEGAGRAGGWGIQGVLTGSDCWPVRLLVCMTQCRIWKYTKSVRDHPQQSYTLVCCGAPLAVAAPHARGVDSIEVTSRTLLFAAPAVCASATSRHQSGRSETLVRSS